MLISLYRNRPKILVLITTMMINMETISINIVNPKVRRIIEDLADLKLIEITGNSKKKSDFFELLDNLRNNEDSLPTLDEITKEK